MTVEELTKVNTIGDYNPTPGENRCDGCHLGRAYVRYFNDDMVIELCYHHSSTNELALMAGGWSKQDRTDLLFKAEAQYKVAKDNNF